MENSHLLIAEIARQCRRLIQERKKPQPNLPFPLQPKHLEWMCNQIERQAEVGLANKWHRWMGFVQAAMLANRLVDLDGLTTLIEAAKRGQKKAAQEREDLLDHLNPASTFELDIGGEG